MSMAARSYDKELLDADNIPFGDMLHVMNELDVINTRLGGHRTTCHGVDYFLKTLAPGTHLNIAEIGCGGGDNLAAIIDYIAKKKRTVKVTGVDLKAECIRVAEQKFGDRAAWICSDYRLVKWPVEKPDIIFSSLFCHHFTDEQLIEQLGWLRANSRLGFFINDLHRHPLAYYSIMALTRLFSRSPIVKYDAPLSVKRAFRKKDWVRLLAAAGITDYTIKWQWAFRYLICAGNEQ